MTTAWNGDSVDALISSSDSNSDPTPKDASDTFDTLLLREEAGGGWTCQNATQKKRKKKVKSKSNAGLRWLTYA
jgi:hypothetical protein